MIRRLEGGTNCNVTLWANHLSVSASNLANLSLQFQTLVQRTHGAGTQAQPGQDAF
jgi:hypothetical protein